MSFFVVINHQVRSERLPDVLALMRSVYARPQGRGPGRRRAHVFQRLGTPTDLLGCLEWDDQDAYDNYRRSAVHREFLAHLAAPSHAQYCSRLASFERMLEPSVAAGCGMITVRSASSVATEHYLLGEGRSEIMAAPGLIAHEVYRTLKSPAQYFVVHRWRELADLDRFRQVSSLRQEQQLAALGATLERFTGVLAAKFPSEE